MKRVFALVDCNNFYVSCERLFNPSLLKKPVVVLSNNDGCVIARSNEAKTIGIKMGEPVFKCKDIIDFFEVKTLSPNFSLYRDISRRIMKILASFSLDIQVYSVDESFLELTSLNISSYYDFGIQIRDKISKEIGIPVSVGISTTKTLAKVASKIAKKREGVFCVFENREDVLKSFPVEDIWGIGRSLSKQFKIEGINYAGQLILKNPKWVMTNFNISFERTYWELLGIGVIDLASHITIPKSMMYSRTFKKSITEKSILRSKIVSFTTSLIESLRDEKLVARKVLLFISGNRFKSGYYKNSKEITLEKYSNLRKYITSFVLQMFEEIYRDGQEYKRAGVIFYDIKTESNINSMFLESNFKDKFCEFSVDLVNSRWDRAIKLGSDEITNKNIPNFFDITSFDRLPFVS